MGYVIGLWLMLSFFGFCSIIGDAKSGGEACGMFAFSLFLGALPILFCWLMVNAIMWAVERGH